MKKELVKVKVLCNIKFSPHLYDVQYSNPVNKEDRREDIHINLFIGNYFIFYSGIFKRRAKKRNTWIFELLYHRGKINKPIRMLVGVEKTYEYKEVYLSAFLVRRIFEESSAHENISDILS